MLLPIKESTRAIKQWRAAVASRPLSRSFLLLDGAFARSFLLGHLFGHLRFPCVKVETRAPLHRREIEEGLKFLRHHLLDKDKTPELELEPIEVLLPPLFGSVLRPALALERIKAQVDQDWHVKVWLGTEPALGLVDETILVVVDTHRAYCAFAKVEDFVTRRRPFAGDGGHLVVAIEVVLVSSVAEFHTLKQLIGYVWVAVVCQQGWEAVQAGEADVLNGICLNGARPSQTARTTSH